METLLDSGAIDSRDFINEATVRRLGLKVEKANNLFQVQIADGRTKQVSRIVNNSIELDRERIELEVEIYNLDI